MCCEPIMCQGYITATSGGRLLLRMITMRFDRYLTDSSAAARPRYSRVI